MKRKKVEMFSDMLMGIQDITLFELHNNINFKQYNYIFEDYFNVEKYNEDYEDIYYCTDNNQYVSIIKLNNK